MTNDFLEIWKNSYQCIILKKSKSSLILACSMLSVIPKGVKILSLKQTPKMTVLRNYKGFGNGQAPQDKA